MTGQAEMHDRVLAVMDWERLDEDCTPDAEARLGRDLVLCAHLQPRDQGFRRSERFLVGHLRRERNTEPSGVGVNLERKPFVVDPAALFEPVAPIAPIEELASSKPWNTPSKLLMH